MTTEALSAIDISRNMAKDQGVACMQVVDQKIQLEDAKRDSAQKEIMCVPKRPLACVCRRLLFAASVLG